MAKNIGTASIKQREIACCEHTGKYAVSTAGHDAGKIYLILGAPAAAASGASPAAYYLADGRRRGADAPKLKKAKHVRVLPRRDEALAQKLCSGGRVTDAELICSLKCFKRLEGAEGSS